MTQQSYTLEIHWIFIFVDVSFYAENMWICSLVLRDLLFLFLSSIYHTPGFKYDIKTHKEKYILTSYPDLLN